MTAPSSSARVKHPAVMTWDARTSSLRIGSSATVTVSANVTNRAFLLVIDDGFGHFQLTSLVAGTMLFSGGEVPVTAGLLGADAAFDFMSMLGALALVGLLIKNAIVLIEEIDQQIDADVMAEQRGLPQVVRADLLHFA